MIYNDSGDSQTIQTIQTSHTLSDSETQEKEKENIFDKLQQEEDQLIEQYISSKSQEIFSPDVRKDHKELVVNTLELNNEENIPKRSIKVKELRTMNYELRTIDPCSLLPTQNAEITTNNYRSNNPQQIEWQWLPEGVWNIDGKLDPSFQDWLANKWVVKYNCDIHEARANVKSYFRNDPVKLPIKWEQYQAEFLAKVENIKTRLNNGCQISEQQQQDTINRLSALKPLNPEQSVSAQTPNINNLGANIYSEQIASLNSEQSISANFSRSKRRENS